MRVSVTEMLICASEIITTPPVETIRSLLCLIEKVLQYSPWGSAFQVWVNLFPGYLRIDPKKQKWGALSNRERQCIYLLLTPFVRGLPQGVWTPLRFWLFVCSWVGFCLLPKLWFQRHLAQKGGKTHRGLEARCFLWEVSQPSAELCVTAPAQLEPQWRSRQGEQVLKRKWIPLLYQRHSPLRTVTVLCTHFDNHLISVGQTLSSWSQTLNLILFCTLTLSLHILNTSFISISSEWLKI